MNNKHYYQHTRSSLIVHIPFGEHRVLEVGCAEGFTGAALKNNGRAHEVVGIELSETAALVAKEKIDRVICGDLEEIKFDAHALANESFDYIVCGDVLEHLKDPWQQLERLLALLKPGGQIIVSLPNIRYFRVTLALFFLDQWHYSEKGGILDLTHLRFFTRSTAIEMLAATGLKDINTTPLIHRRTDKWLNKATLGLIAGIFVPQWVFNATKTVKFDG